MNSPVSKIEQVENQAEISTDFSKKIISFKIAAIQMVSSNNWQENCQQAKQFIEKAAKAGAQLVLLPEYFCLIGQKEDFFQIKERIDANLEDQPIKKMLANVARAQKIWLIGGTLPIASTDPKRVFNATFVYDPNGNEVIRYDKIHLFSFEKGSESFCESNTIVPGEKITTFDAPFGRVALSVCYDLRFPELYRAAGDCALIVVPAAFTYTTGKEHWEILLRARAIENQCYVLAAAQGGTHSNGRHTWGHSMLIDPWGKIIDECKEEGPGLVSGEINLDYLRDVRESLPALKHRVF